MILFKTNSSKIFGLKSKLQERSELVKGIKSFICLRGELIKSNILHLKVTVAIYINTACLINAGTVN